MANWYSDRNARCALLEGQKGGFSLGNGDFQPVTPQPPKPTVKAQGRVKLDPSGTAPAPSQLTICQKAWQARLRNSPAAPGLEASCAAPEEHQPRPRA